VWDPDPAIGTKYCLSNAFTKVDRKPPPQYRHNIPVYDAYKVVFNLCDRLNSAIHGRIFPYRCGGGSHYGESGHQHKFAMAIILQNTFRVYNCMHKIDTSNYNFTEYCRNLAEQLVNHASTMYE
jgi:hypothetical protein